MPAPVIEKRIIGFKFYILCFLIFFSGNVFAQNNTTERATNYFSYYSDTSVHDFSILRPYYIAAWSDKIPPGFNVVRRIEDNTAIIKVRSKTELIILGKYTSIMAAKDTWKFTKSAGQLLQENNSNDVNLILASYDVDELRTTIEKLNGPLKILSVDRLSNSMIVKTTPRYTNEKLIKLIDVVFIDVKAMPVPEIKIIGYNRSFHGLSAVDFLLPTANGKNIVVGVKEQKMNAEDLDLYKRVLPSSLAAPNTTNHATVVASIIGGAGNSSYYGKGIANACKFFSSSFSNLFPDDQAILNSNNVSVQNHSYGTIIQQFYGAEAVSYDVNTWLNKDIIHVFSAGNMGSSFASEGQFANIPGQANITGNFKMAKNIVTVGAVDNKGEIPLESSAGPAYDGRLAPQLVALGPNGTSDAAAIVSGTIAVMQQVYKDNNNQLLPPASLVKAVLYNCADDIYRTGIDYKTGYGLLNSLESAETISLHEYDGDTLLQSGEWTKTLMLPVNTAAFKLTLAWTDSAGQINNSKALVNDLDLELIELSNGFIYKPWVLNSNPNIDSLIHLPTRERDSLNTAEQISISFPTPGNYLIKVIGKSINTSFATFNISWHVDTLHTFKFISPQHSADVNRNENPVLDIRWRTFVADSNETGNLLISFDRGINWQTINAFQKLNSNVFYWTIKDTNSTAILKMETSFGNFFSREFIICDPSRINVDFLCNDSVGLSWKKHAYATAYNIYSQTDSAFLKLTKTVTDTFAILNRTQYTSLVYAVEPILSNGISASRGNAQDITLAGVNCFYKTFYNVLLDQNEMDLIIELSSNSFVDSLIFEQVNAFGQVLKIAGTSKVSLSSLTYHQGLTGPDAGTTYWRVKIKLNSGATVYTETITVLTSGNRYLLLYPNPVRGDRNVSCLLQQGLPSDCKLRIYDISGRLLMSFHEIPDNINLSKLSPGILIYMLFGNDNRLLETGKLLVK